ncbi:CPBP family intramembrane glutamic endopeptidase [Companilactobacillus kimchiensis]|uniref:CAAX prenyl protease 2/Lysostaphin resistance protein A-like domain-containing protein n=1 Tax=Companilactobacillus kimchiensis TaxID=993692 RepID=A0A0R2LHA0_9LACO|nr:type II CAAX endopeptidase family protein [Companilactobacillus kimchiensis]KRN98892.1 hypothetical protein IV57_GL000702 [Companilactobacillus kimchiensis]
MKTKIWEFSRKAIWLFGIFILYQLTQVPFIIPTLKKIHSSWVQAILIIVGVILSILLVRYIWRSFNGDLNPKVNFLPNWNLKQRIWIYLILLVALLGLGYLAGDLPTSSNQTEIEKMFQGNRWAILIAVNLCGPVIEELIFRGTLQKLFFNKMENLWQMGAYVVISTGLFVWIHEPAMNLQMVPYILMGLVFSLAYVLLGNIKYDISLHIINNIVSSIGIILSL